MPNPTTPETVCTELQGFLRAFAWINTKTNHGCDYSIYQVPKVLTCTESLGRYFDVPSASVQLTPMADWSQDLSALLEEWLFAYQRTSEDHLVDPRQSFTLTDDYGHRMVIDQLMTKFRQLQPTAGWTANVPCEELREFCFQQDVVLESPNHLYLIHFGVSD
jgi:hypothetical protein